jgi:hypothetical protein
VNTGWQAAGTHVRAGFISTLPSLVFHPAGWRVILRYFVRTFRFACDLSALPIEGSSQYLIARG